jgi:prepilin-type N-terminal cleavage/methylation domain-containing protein
MRKLRGFTLIELLIVVAIIAILAAIAVPNFLEAQVRSKVSRVKSDQRSMATALEAYYVDNNIYPAMGWDNTTRPRQTVQAPGRSFRIRSTATQQFQTLTTPIAYITTYFADAFADTRGLTFRYFTDGPGWILGSFGPDTDEASSGDMGWAEGDLPVTNTTRNPGIETVYNSYQSQPNATLVAGAQANGSHTYDPTNGTVSSGDVWRVKE